jgi:hypothetical protein
VLAQYRFFGDGWHRFGWHGGDWHGGGWHGGGWHGGGRLMLVVDGRMWVLGKMEIWDRLF